MTLEPLDYQPPPPDSPSMPCPHCGGTATRGRLIDYSGVRFVPDFVKSILVPNAGVRVTAYACRECGVVTLSVDEEHQPRLAKLTTPGTFWRRCGRLVGRLRKPGRLRRES